MSAAGMVRLTAADAMSNEATRRTYKAILHCIGRVLRDRNENVVKEPIPSRWVQLIKQLNEKERGASTIPQSRCGDAGSASARLPRREATNEQPNATTRR
jgi:hypothetical protein